MLTYKRFHFLDTTYQCKDVSYEYDTISGIDYRESNATINLVNTRGVDLWIFSTNGKHKLSASSMYRDSKKMKAIRQIHTLVSKKTFNNRLQLYLKQIESDGFFVYDNAKIYLSGTVEKKNKIFNLVEIYQQNGLTLGESGEWGFNSYSNSYKLHLENRDKFFSFNHLWIKCSYNRDVFFQLVNHIISKGMN